MDGTGNIPFPPSSRGNLWSTNTTNGPVLHNSSALVGGGLTGDNDWDEWMRWDPLSPALSPSQHPPQLGDRVHNSYFFPRAHGALASGNNGIVFESGLQPKLENGNDLADTNAMRLNRESPFRFGDPSSIKATFDYSNPAIPPPFGDSQKLGDASHENLSSMPTQPAGQQNYIKPQSTPLSLSEIKELQSIAFPSTSANGQIPTDIQGCGSSSSPDPMPPTGNPKKRKSSTEDDNGDSPPNLDQANTPVKKTAHNMIEKRYRTNLNDKIAALRDSVPSLRVMSKGSTGDAAGDEAEDLEGLTPAHKLNKATVLSKATEYINHLEKRNKKLVDENTALKIRLQASEKLILAGAMTINPSVRSPSAEISPAVVHPNQQVLSPSATGPAIDPTSSARIPSVTEGMIPVPESMRRLHAAQAAQQHQFEPRQANYALYNHARAMAPENASFSAARRPSNFVSKLMVGSLAGLMIVEGLSTRSQKTSKTDEPDKGLSAMPLQSLRHVARSLGSAGPFDDTQSKSGLFTLFKASLLIFCLVYLFSSLLTDLLKKKPKGGNPTVHLSAAPSLAAPVEVRRKAWLTAIQTVWVPQHSFLLEAAALGLKTLKLSTRKLIGWKGYALLTGQTKEHEAARVKAWEIALDAQLTGGDAEISKSRLLLTLMASGTLPDTPARLMLKALHIRVFLWEVANAGYGSWFLFEDITAKLARRYWNAAKHEHNLLKQSSNKSKPGAELLPSHLSSLLENECDDVLVDSIVQRAYNLAWNRPSGEDSSAEGTMDSVVEDFSIASPLDALAAWWSSLVLDKVILNFLEATNAETKDISSELELAVQTAPPRSGASARALAAKAILDYKHRYTNLSAACEALPASTPITPPLPGVPAPTPLVNLVSDTPISFDVRISLTFAKCIWLVLDLASSSPAARNSAIAVVNQSCIQLSQCTLLSVVAAIQVLRLFSRDPVLIAEMQQGLESLAYTLRLWIGRESCRKSGLSSLASERLISECLVWGKKLAGITEVVSEAEDDGYVSASSNDSGERVGSGVC